MKQIYKNCLGKSITIVGSLLILAILFLWGTSGRAVSDSFGLENSVLPENTVSFFETVSPNSFGTVGAVVIGTKQATLEDLNEAIRPSGGKLLIVTSITAYHITPTNTAPFSVVTLLALSGNGSTRGWGSSGLSVSGLQTIQVNYQPGLVVQLTPDETLSIRSFIQSNDIVRVGVHGYLMESP